MKRFQIYCSANKMKNSFYIKKIFALITAIAATAAFLPAQTTKPAPRQEKLLNGLKLYFLSDPQAADVRVKIRVHSGSAFDPQSKEGTMQMLADNIFPNEAAREFFTDDLGGSLEVITNYDYIQINAAAKPEEFLTMIETLANAVAKPVIDKEITAKLRAAQIEKVRRLEQNPVYVADQTVARRLFGAFPYGRAQFGTTESLQKIDFADLIFAKDRFFTADNATMIVTGNFKTDLALRAARRYFGAWAKSDGKIAPTFRQPDAPDAKILLSKMTADDSAQLRYAFRGLARNDADFYASAILTEILQTRIQEKEGKNAVVQHDAHVLPGIVLVKLSDSDATRVNLTGGEASFSGNYKDFVAEMLKSEIKPAEFETARSVVLGELKKQDAADQWLDVDTYRLSSVKDELQKSSAVTLNDVQKIVERWKKEPVATAVVVANK